MRTTCVTLTSSLTTRTSKPSKFAPSPEQPGRGLETMPRRAVFGDTQKTGNPLRDCEGCAHRNDPEDALDRHGTTRCCLNPRNPRNSEGSRHYALAR